MTVIAVSGYFDPIHVGHLEYLKMAKSLGDKLVVIINSDYQAELKKGKSFMPEADRLEIVGSLRCVDEVFLSIDKDKSVCKSLEHIKPDIFANGGDRSLEEIPETAVMENILNGTVMDRRKKKGPTRMEKEMDCGFLCGTI